MNLKQTSRILLLCLFLSGFSLAISAKTKKPKIAFFVNHMSVRGIEVATFDYADYNETYLGNKTIIINFTEYASRPGNDLNPDFQPAAKKKFKERFGANFFDCATMHEVNEVLKREKVDIFYAQKAGAIDDKVSKVCKNAMHAVFPEVQVHGDKYACISSWLSGVYPHLKLPYVPYMVRLEETKETLHEALGIPHGAVVFGRHGGANSFDIKFAQEAVIEVAQQHANWYFIFLNTDKFCDLPNVIFLPSTADMVYKTKFINTCDAMIHARERGETFGLACAEFSIQNKAVITWANSPEKSHIDILRNKGLYYTNKHDLITILEMCGNDVHTVRAQDWDAYSKDYNPEAVMKKFDQVFIKPLIK